MAYPTGWINVGLGVAILLVSLLTFLKMRQMPFPEIEARLEGRFGGKERPTSAGSMMISSVHVREQNSPRWKYLLNYLFLKYPYGHTEVEVGVSFEKIDTEWGLEATKELMLEHEMVTEVKHLEYLTETAEGVEFFRIVFDSTNPNRVTDAVRAVTDEFTKFARVTT